MSSGHGHHAARGPGSALVSAPGPVNLLVDAELVFFFLLAVDIGTNAVNCASRSSVCSNMGLPRLRVAICAIS